ncbi:MAG: hypothetical protein U1A27_10195 [Phycisphaerae bacterium]
MSSVPATEQWRRIVERISSVPGDFIAYGSSLEPRQEYHCVIRCIGAERLSFSFSRLTKQEVERLGSAS